MSSFDPETKDDTYFELYIQAQLDIANKKFIEEIPSLLSEIDSLREKFYAQMRPAERLSGYLINDFLPVFTYNSNAIENNTLTLDQVRQVLNDKVISDVSLRDHLEVIGHRNAFLHILDMADRNTVPHPFDNIPKIHELLLIDQPKHAGRIRNKNVRVGDYIAPKYDRVGSLLVQLFNFEKRDLHPVEYAAIHHLRFEHIHPFIDGNGRIGRLLMNLILLLNQYPPVNIRFKNRLKYYECFKLYQQHEITVPMVHLIASELISGLREYFGMTFRDTRASSSESLDKETRGILSKLDLRYKPGFLDRTYGRKTKQNP